MEHIHNGTTRGLLMNTSNTSNVSIFDTTTEQGLMMHTHVLKLIYSYNALNSLTLSFTYPIVKARLAVIGENISFIAYKMLVKQEVNRLTK